MSTVILPTGEAVEVFVPRRVADRLRNTCFRGTRFKVAGNFSVWAYFSEFISDGMVKDSLSQVLAEIIARDCVNKHSRISLTFPEPIGWSSAVDKEKLSMDVLAVAEEKVLNRKAKALFIPRGIIRAPQTSIVTIVLSISYTDRWIFYVQTMYPGKDVGDLVGDMTAKTEQVWLGWDNIGV